MFGAQGELWDQASSNNRLLDWSYAGYGEGPQPQPSMNVACNVVEDYGAVGDGLTDSSEAFLRAIEATETGVIFVPPGTYLLNTQLVITRSGVSIKGAGQTQTTIFFNSSLTDLYGNNWKGGDGWNGTINGKFSQWMNAPGLIRFLGQGPEWWREIASVTSKALRGSNHIEISDATHLVIGSWISIGLSADQGNLLFKDLNKMPASSACSGCMNPTTGNGQRGGKGDALRFHSKVLSVVGSRVTLERPLPFNISMEYEPTVYSFMRGVSEVGISDLIIEMRHSSYEGHFLEPGFNGVEFSDASNCWARNLTILNGDTLLSFYRSSFCTADLIKTGVTASRNNQGTRLDCHHGINVSSSQDILISNVNHKIKCHHDMTVFNFTLGVAFINITGPDLSLDHHRFYPYGTLWQNIDVGLGSRVFEGGGLTPWGSASSSFTTFWNVKSLKGVSSVPKRYDFGRNANFVAMGWKDPSLLVDLVSLNSNSQSWVVENVPNGKRLIPIDLYNAMKEIRMQ